MFDNVAEAFHFNADLNPDLTHCKQPQIHAWTEGEKQRPVKRITAAEFQKGEQKIAHYLRSIGVKAGTRVAIISADGPYWSQFEAAVWDADGARFAMQPAAAMPRGAAIERNRAVNAVEDELAKAKVDAPKGPVAAKDLGLAAKP